MSENMQRIPATASRKESGTEEKKCASRSDKNRKHVVLPLHRWSHRKDQGWRREQIIRGFEDFEDLSRDEKDFMGMWNLFLLNKQCKPHGRCQLYRTCRLFLQRHREELNEKNLGSAWVFHLTVLHEHGALDSDEVYDLIMRLQKGYDAEEDMRHILNNTKKRLEASERSTVRSQPSRKQDSSVGCGLHAARSCSFSERSSVSTSESDGSLTMSEIFERLNEASEITSVNTGTVPESPEFSTQGGTIRSPLAKSNGKTINAQLPNSQCNVKLEDCCNSDVVLDTFFGSLSTRQQQN